MKIKEKYLRKLAKHRLINRYNYLNEVNKILEEYIKSRIMNGGSADFLAKSRQDLINKQNEIKESERLVSFLRKL